MLSTTFPQVITHEKVLVDCEDDLNHFLKTMDALEDKLGPLLFQFGYFNKTKFKSGKEFLARLRPFLKTLPKGYDFAVEIRNWQWPSAEFFDLLREHKVAFALIDQAWMPRPSEMFEKVDPITAHFAYVRWLGDRKGIEERTKTWDKTIIDREVEIGEWVQILKRVVKAFAYANNHCRARSRNGETLPGIMGQQVMKMEFREARMRPLLLSIASVRILICFFISIDSSLPSTYLNGIIPG